MTSQDRRYQYDQYQQDDYFRDSSRERWQRDGGRDDDRRSRSDRDYRDAFSGYGQGRDAYPRQGASDERSGRRDDFGRDDRSRDEYRREDDSNRGDYGWRRQNENFYGQRGGQWERGGRDDQNSREFQNREPYRAGYPSFGGYGQGSQDWRRDQGNYERHGRDARRSYDEQDSRPLWDRASDEVSSWFGDEDAARRRRGDEARDERARYHGVGPKNYKRSDDRIREDVSDRLSDDPYVNAANIEVAVSGGEVTLSGLVDDREQRRRAEIVAERVTGASHVQNNLRVQERGQGQRDQGSHSASSSAQQGQYGLGAQQNGGGASSQSQSSSSAAKHG